MYKEVVEAKLFHLVHPLRIKGGSLGKVTFKTLGITCGDTHDPCRITLFHGNATAVGGFPIESACFRAKYIRLHDRRDFYYNLALGKGWFLQYWKRTSRAEKIIS